MFDYQEEYQKAIRCSNILQIKDKEAFEAYEQIIRLKFLIHVATSMFYSQEV